MTRFTPSTRAAMRQSAHFRLLLQLLAFDRALLAATGRSKLDSLSSPNRPAKGFK